MNAILLAAGVGRRLGLDDDQHPKCLLEIGGQSLLERHLRHLCSCASRVTIVTGHGRDAVEQRMKRWRASHIDSPSIELAYNPRFEEGSILSLQTGLRRSTEGDLLVMDADVIYDYRLLERLLRAPASTCLLMDELAELEDEEMVIGVQDKRAMTLRRARDITDFSGFDAVGEGVGFLKVDRADKAALIAAVDSVIEQRRVMADYEDAIDSFLGQVRCGVQSVAGLPWLEIDFPDDHRRAENDIVPELI